MSASNSTSNYQLPQYIGTDTPKYLTDFNNAMLKIDTALKQIADSIPDTSNLETIQDSIETIQSSLESISTELDTLSQSVETASETATSSNTLSTQNKNILNSFFDGFNNINNWNKTE